jgi:hypothetical protein
MVVSNTPDFCTRFFVVILQANPTFNSLDGKVTSNMAIVPTTHGSIDAFATDPTQLTRTREKGSQK